MSSTQQIHGVNPTKFLSEGPATVQEKIVSLSFPFTRKKRRKVHVTPLPSRGTPFDKYMLRRILQSLHLDHPTTCNNILVTVR